MQAVSQEGDKDVSLDALLGLMKDRPDRKIAFQVPERLFDIP